MIQRVPVLGSSLGQLSRRDFVKFCSAAAVYMGLPASMGEKIAEAATSPIRPPVIWLSGQECTGCTETLLRTDHPTLASLILETISLEYHEALNAGAGHQAEKALQDSVKQNQGKFILVIDGTTPVKDNGIYCKIGGKTMLSIVEEIAPKAFAAIAMGSCASWGGMPSADPNPTGATSAPEVFKMKGIKTPIVSIPGCPPNPYNFLGTVLYFLTFKKLPELDAEGRPKFAYGRLIHENCERRPHFDAGRFAQQFGDDGHRKGYCLYKLGCKGPETFNNCPTLLFNDTGSGSWPVGTGHPCFGCSEKGVGFNAPLHSPAKPKYVTPPAIFSEIFPQQGAGATVAGVAVAAGVVGAAVGAGVAMAKNLGKSDDGKADRE